RMHSGADCSLRDGRPQLCFDALAEQTFFFRPARAQRRASDHEPLAHDFSQVQLYFRALRGGDVDEATALREQLDMLAEVVAAYHVEDHLDAFAFRPGPGCGYPVLAFVIPC